MAPTLRNVRYLDTPVQDPQLRPDWGMELPEQDRFTTLIMEADQYVKSLFSEPEEFTTDRDFMDQVRESRPYRDRELQVMIATLASLRRIARVKGVDHVLRQIGGPSDELVEDIWTDMSEFSDVSVSGLTVPWPIHGHPPHVRTGKEQSRRMPGMYFNLRPIHHGEIRKSMQRVLDIERRYAQAIFLQPYLVNTGTRGPDALRKALWLYWPIAEDVRAEIHRQNTLSKERRNWESTQEFWDEQRRRYGDEMLANEPHSFEEWVDRSFENYWYYHSQDESGGEPLQTYGFGTTFLTRWVLSYMKYMHVSVKSVSRSRQVKFDRAGGDERVLTQEQRDDVMRSFDVSPDHDELIFWLREWEPEGVQILERGYDLRVLIEGVLERYLIYEHINGDDSVDPWDFVLRKIREMSGVLEVVEPGSYASRADLQRVLSDRPLLNVLALARRLPPDHKAVLYFNMGYADAEFICRWNRKPSIEDLCVYYGMKRHEYYRLLGDVIAFFDRSDPIYVQGTFPGMSPVNAEIESLDYDKAFWIRNQGRVIVDRNHSYIEEEYFLDCWSKICSCIAGISDRDLYARALLLNEYELSLLFFLQGDFDEQIREMGLRPDVEGACLFLRMIEYNFGDSLRKLRWLFDPEKSYYDYQRVLPDGDDIEALRELEATARNARTRVVRKPIEEMQKEAEDEDGGIPF